MDLKFPNNRKLAQQMAKMSEEQRAELVRARKAVALQVFNFLQETFGSSEEHQRKKTRLDYKRIQTTRKLALPLHQEL